MELIKKISVLVLLVFFCLPIITLAVSSGAPTNVNSGTPTNVSGPGNGNSSLSVKLANPISSNTVSALLSKLLDLVVQIGVVVVTMGIIYSGFLYATARGNSSKVKSAHETFYWTIIGAAIVLGAFAITKVVGDTAAQLFG